MLLLLKIATQCFIISQKIINNENCNLNCEKQLVKITKKLIMHKEIKYHFKKMHLVSEPFLYIACEMSNSKRMFHVNCKQKD